jgi:pyrroline-5-carboxylate reductase
MLTVDSKLFVSVMAGITIKSLGQALGNIILEPRIIRAHPNTPAMVGCGCAVYSLGESASEADGEVVRQLFGSVGICEKVPEYQQVSCLKLGQI